MGSSCRAARAVPASPTTRQVPDFLIRAVIPPDHGVVIDYGHRDPGLRTTCYAGSRSGVRVRDAPERKEDDAVLSTKVGVDMSGASTRTPVPRRTWATLPVWRPPVPLTEGALPPIAACERLDAHRRRRAPATSSGGLVSRRSPPSCIGALSNNAGSPRGRWRSMHRAPRSGVELPGRAHVFRPEPANDVAPGRSLEEVAGHLRTPPRSVSETAHLRHGPVTPGCGARPARSDRVPVGTGREEPEKPRSRPRAWSPRPIGAADATMGRIGCWLPRSGRRRNSMKRPRSPYGYVSRTPCTSSDCVSSRR